MPWATKIATYVLAPPGLGEIGPDARAAIPALEAALFDGEGVVSIVVEKSLRKIAPGGVRIHTMGLMEHMRQDVFTTQSSWESWRERISRAGIDPVMTLPRNH